MKRQTLFLLNQTNTGDLTGEIEGERDFMHFQQPQPGPLRKLKIAINKYKVSDNNF